MTTEENHKQPEILPAGTVLDDKFEIIKPLGAGSFGTVYMAKHLVFGHRLRNVALKLFKSEAITQENAREVFEDAITLMGLQEEDAPPEVAPRLIQVYDLGVLNDSKGQAYLAMKLIPDAKGLHREITRVKAVGGMRVKPATDLLRKLLVPLAWMHTLDPPLVHGDLKPDNVLLTSARDIVLVDFGLASRLPLGSIGGAIQYQAPETLFGTLGQAAADVYAIGLIWYEMLTARQPFAEVGLEALANDDQRAYVEAQRKAREWPIGSEGEERIPSASEINEDLRGHPQVEEMLNRCLRYKPSERYPNAFVLLNAIDDYFPTGEGGAGESSGCEGAPVPRTRPTTEKDDTARSAADVDALLRQGRIDEAQKMARHALMRDQRSVMVLCAYARALSAGGDFERALKKCETARKLAEREPGVLETMAAIYEQQGADGLASTLRQQAQKLR